jgi:hypothetical protein
MGTFNPVFYHHGALSVPKQTLLRLAGLFFVCVGGGDVGCEFLTVAVGDDVEIYHVFR